MKDPKAAIAQPPKFANENDEADWWAGPEGRKFLKTKSNTPAKKPRAGSKLLTPKANPLHLSKPA